MNSKQIPPKFSRFLNDKSIIKMESIIEMKSNQISFIQTSFKIKFILK